MNTHEAITALPKVELHVHILGTIRPRTLLDFIDEGGFETPYKSEEDLAQLFQFQDFGHFISVYSEVVNFISKEKQFERLAFEMLEDLAASNVRYAEISFSAPDHMRRRELEFGAMLDAIDRGIRRAHRKTGIEADVRIDLVRNYGPESAMEVLDWIRERLDSIVSVDIGGSEHNFPAKPFAPVYKEARNLGLHLVAHAGEAEGPESIWDVIKFLEVERIGHGTSAIKDAQLMDHIKEKGIAIESCPVSNVRTGVVASIEEHPIREFYDRGLLVTVNSDDPAFFDTNITFEYTQLHDKLGFSLADLYSITQNGIESAFLSEARKESLQREVEKSYSEITETS
ncbi:MAG: adenosine deaminase [Candidatus Thorarchaeota archaeon]|jgi:adenosine deaminase